MVADTAASRKRAEREREIAYEMQQRFLPHTFETVTVEVSLGL